MFKFLADMPRPLIALIVMTIAIGVIWFNNPPRTVCDTQIEAFRKSQAGKFFDTKGKTKLVPAQVRGLRRLCEEGLGRQSELNNFSAGICFEYFYLLKGMLADLSIMNSECVAEVFNIGHFQDQIAAALLLLAEMAWGPEVPRSVGNFGSLQMADLALYCKIKDAIILGRGDEGWEKIQRHTIKKLKGSDQLTYPEAWSRSIFAFNCANVL